MKQNKVIQITNSALTPDLKTWVYQEFSEHAVITVGFDGLTNEPITFIAKDNDIIIAICTCQLFWGNLHIKYLFTKKEYQRQGIAKTLMQYALAYGKEQDASFAFAETMSFQAPEFYQKLGFKVDLERTGFTQDLSYLYLSKAL